MLSTLKQSYNRAVSWLSAYIPHKAPNAFNTLTLSWMDEQIGYPGITKALFSNNVSHDYNLNGSDCDLREDYNIAMRFQIIREEDLSRIVIYSGYAQSHTGTVLSLKKTSPESFEVTEFYTCENGRLRAAEPQDEENIADFLRIIPTVLNYVQKNNCNQILRNSWVVVKGGLTP